MGMHRPRPSTRKNPLKDPVERALAVSVGQKIARLRICHALSRQTVCETEVVKNCKRLRQLEEGHRVATLDEVVKLARLYRVDYMQLLCEVMTDAEVQGACDAYAPLHAREQQSLDSLFRSRDHLQPRS